MTPPPNLNITHGFYGGNSKIPEGFYQGILSNFYLNGIAKNNITRGFYGGRANVPEGYYRGLSASITYLKNANVINSSQINLLRQIQIHKTTKVISNQSITLQSSKFKIKTAFVITNQIAKFITNKPFYISKIESAITQQFLQSNSYALVDNVDIVGDFTSENDLLPNDWTEPDSPSGEDVIPT